jgi:hypothetical protein
MKHRTVVVVFAASGTRNPERLFVKFLLIVLIGILVYTAIFIKEYLAVFGSGEINVVLDWDAPHRPLLGFPAEGNDTASPSRTAVSQTGPPTGRNDTASPSHTAEIQPGPPTWRNGPASRSPIAETNDSFAPNGGIDHAVGFWRFDEAAPKVHHSDTHFLQSIPSAYRLSPSSNPWNATEYFSHSENVWPQKVHLFEMNPSIARLPTRYQRGLAVRDEVPVYLATYRVTHLHNCFGHGAYERMLGGSWANLKSIKSDHLGLALLRSDLSVLVDAVVSFRNSSAVKGILPNAQDYRVFNLHEELYVTSVDRIAPIYMSMFDTSDNRDTSRGQDVTKEEQPPSHFLRVPPAFAEDDSRNGPILQLWIRDFASCPYTGSAEGGRKRSSSKNLLYFVDGRNQTMVEHYPSTNPNDVRTIELNAKCSPHKIVKSDFDHPNRTSDGGIPPASFPTIDEFHFPVSERKFPIFTADRGSACCTSFVDPTTGKDVFVGVVHPKTMFPGRNLPQGVIRNTYLSRFYAFETEAPYRIVARSGMFCLGYVDAEVEKGLQQSTSPLISVKMDRMHFAGEFFDCPRLHFVTGMVDKVGDDSRVILSYGVNDCFSRFVEIEKSEIARLLWNPKRIPAGANNRTAQEFQS